MKKQITQMCFTEKFAVEYQKATIDPGERQFFVRNTHSLISPGTELALYTGTHVGFQDPDITWARYPILPGYASVGIIEHSGCPEKGTVGDKILHCSTHSTHSLVDPDTDLFFILEEGIDEKAALFAKFAQISATAVNICHVQPSFVLVFGAGLIGNLCAQLYQIKGVDVILADISEKRLEIAKQCGIRKVVHSGNADFQQTLHTLTDGRGVDLIVEATGVPALVNQSLELINGYGEVLLLGSTRGTVEINVYKLIHRKKVMLVGAHEGYFPLKSGKTLSHEKIIRQNLTYVARGDLTTAPLISHEITPEEVKEAYEGLLNEKEKYLGVIIHWMKEGE